MISLFLSLLGLAAFENEGIQNITALKDQLVSGNHEQSESIIKRHGDVIARWKKLLDDSLDRKKKLQVMQVKYIFALISVSDISLTFIVVLFCLKPERWLILCLLLWFPINRSGSDKSRSCICSLPRRRLLSTLGLRMLKKISLILCVATGKGQDLSELLSSLLETEFT